MVASIFASIIIIFAVFCRIRTFFGTKKPKGILRTGKKKAQYTLLLWIRSFFSTKKKKVRLTDEKKDVSFAKMVQVREHGVKIGDERLCHSTNHCPAWCSSIPIAHTDVIEDEYETEMRVHGYNHQPNPHHPTPTERIQLLLNHGVDPTELQHARMRIASFRDSPDSLLAQERYNDFANWITHNDQDEESLEYSNTYETQQEAHAIALKLMEEMKAWEDEQGEVAQNCRSRRRWNDVRWLAGLMGATVNVATVIIIASVRVARSAATWIEDRRLDELIHIDELIHSRSFEELHRVLHVRVERNRRNRLRRRQLIAVLAVAFVAISGVFTVKCASRITPAPSALVLRGPTTSMPVPGPQDKQLPVSWPKFQPQSPLLLESTALVTVQETGLVLYRRPSARFERTDFFDASSRTRRQAVGG